MRKPERTFGLVALGAVLVLAACSGNYAGNDDVDAPRGPQRDPNRLSDESVFGDDGLSLSALRNGSIFGSTEEGGSLPVNKFLWQAALDTLSFLPLSSTDPFTGVIATDWSSTPDAPGERFKVTVFIVTPELAASALKVAVYREAHTEGGLWVPRPVSPETPRGIEDAILTRARQIRIAELESGSTG